MTTEVKSAVVAEMPRNGCACARVGNSRPFFSLSF